MAMNNAIPPEEMTAFGKFLRSNRIGTTLQQSRRSVERYEELHGQITVEQLRRNFSEILIECYQIETEIFIDIRNEIGGIWVHDLLEHANRRIEFPTISNLVDQAIAILNRDEPAERNLSDATIILQNVNDGLSQSMRQAARPRAGGAFENYLGIFFRILGFRFQPQVAIQRGEILDFVFPNSTFFPARQHNAIWMECQTSLRDRFRLTIGKTNAQNERSAKFLATLAGLGLLNQGDVHDLDPDMIREIHQHTPQSPWRVVALRQVAEDRNSPTVISFEDFVNTVYPNASGLW